MSKESDGSDSDVSTNSDEDHHQKDNQEQQFKDMINKLLLFSVNKINEKDVFKFGVDSITLKSYEDDLKFSMADLAQCHFKSELYVKFLEQEYLNKEANSA